MDFLLIKIVEAWLATLRLMRFYDIASKRCLDSGEPFIIALWHRDLIYSLYHFRGSPGVIMTSASKDGEWIARALRQWGQYTVRGSRQKGGKRAIMDMARLMRRMGIGAGIVADGSKGPALKVQTGPVVLSRITNAPIIPIGLAFSRAVRLNTWDRLIIPVPFSQAAIFLSKPIYVPSDARGEMIESYKRRLETALNDAHGEAKRLIS